MDAVEPAWKPGRRGEQLSLIGLSQYVPTTANVKAYIRIVLEKSTLRKLIRASTKIPGMLQPTEPIWEA